MRTTVKIIKSITLELEPNERWVVNQNIRNLTTFVADKVSFRFIDGQIEDLKISGKALRDGHRAWGPMKLNKLPDWVQEFIGAFDWAAAPAIEEDERTT